MTSDGPAQAPAGTTRGHRARARLAILATALAAGYTTYRILHASDLDQTALLFVGLPAVLAVALALTPPARTVTGMVMKGTTLALLLSGILLIEGVVCILVAAPLFYAVALAVAWAIRRARGGAGDGPDPRPLAVVGAAIALLGSEGVWPATTTDRAETVTAVRVVEGSPDDVARALAAVPAFDERLPAVLRLGFPRPVAAEGGGLALGDHRAVTFAGRPPGTLRLEVADRAPGRARFVAVSDTTPIAGWVGWREAEVRWAASGAGRTRVTWTLRFERRLDPSWYFAPIQRGAARAAAGYLLDTLATP